MPRQASQARPEAHQPGRRHARGTHPTHLTPPPRPPPPPHTPHTHTRPPHPALPAWRPPLLCSLLRRGLVWTPRKRPSRRRQRRGRQPRLPSWPRRPRACASCLPSSRRAPSSGPAPREQHTHRPPPTWCTQPGPSAIFCTLALFGCNAHVCLWLDAPSLVSSVQPRPLPSPWLVHACLSALCWAHAWQGLKLHQICARGQKFKGLNPYAAPKRHSAGVRSSARAVLRTRQARIALEG